mmetsp:Transcript_29500/g.63906  ORF Transcript_29500/g.63906 Transcript_29500/m.63906 type:complete len:615 (-) Transcript_29500:236-2080(-)
MTRIAFLPVLLLGALVASPAAVMAQDTDPADLADCTVKCKHGSTCAAGWADYGILKELNPNLVSGQDGYHCDCSSDDKHTGLTCETKVERCDKNTSCFNGGKCSRQEEDGEWGCDCTKSDGFFSGKYCEMEATAICDASDDGLETKQWFCTNGGSCRDNNSDVNKKCSCPDGFKGPHCEVKKGSKVAEKQGEPEQCDLPCKQGGQCVHGFKDHGEEHEKIDDLYFLKKKEKRGMHCICPEGHAGVQCEINLDKCGSQYCYHGATCLQEDDGFGTGGRRFCDCTTATDLLDSKHLFAGKWCQNKATKVCGITGEGKLPHFCTNGGTCAKQEHMGCDCPEGYYGPFCEYKGKEPKCSVKCKNGGQCRHGVNYDFERGISEKFDLGDAFNQGHINFEYCSCPEGYYGIDCSMKIKKCGPDADPDHVCANDGECVPVGTKDDGGTKWGCDCKGGTWAGQHCENPASQICVISGDPIEAGNKGAFCTNGGTCVQLSDKKDFQAGCDCPVGFNGKKCQYKNGVVAVKEVSTPSKGGSGSKSTSSSASSSSGGGMSGTGIFIIVVVVIASVLIIASIVVRRRYSASWRHGKQPDIRMAPTANLSPAKSIDDDGEFKEVHMI